jgi:hypothetical protein
VASWTLKVRVGPRVERRRFAALDPALDALEQRIEELAETTRRDDVHFFRRTIEAARQVAVRAEVAGPGRILPAVRGGVDLRGDGSTEAFTGHTRRELIETQAGESGVAALRRALAGGVADSEQGTA